MVQQLPDVSVTSVSLERVLGATVRPTLLDRAVILRHAAATCDLNVASIYFNNCGKRDEVTKCFQRLIERPEANLSNEELAKLRTEKDLRKWYALACKACMSIIDRRTACRNKPYPEGENADGALTDAESALRLFITIGGHQPLDLVRRSMQLVCVSAARQDIRGGSLSTSSFDLPRTRAPIVRLFISGKTPAGQPALLDYFGITHVITCFKTGTTIDVGAGRQRLVLPSIDDDVYDMRPDMVTAIKYVKDSLALSRESSESDRSTESALSDGPPLPMLPGKEDMRLLVHCSAGMHRCTAICSAIMVGVLGWRLSDALEAIRVARPMAEPTESFAKQLKQFASRYVA
jgi:hypothetical protein